jgi:uncharacterized protein YjbJ (UPF0337 family)
MWLSACLLRLGAFGPNDTSARAHRGSRSSAFGCPKLRRRPGSLSNDQTDREATMNKDVFEGKWKEMRGQVKE